MPDISLVRAELEREKKKIRYINLGLAAALVVAVLVIIIVAASGAASPAIKMTGDSMEPTLSAGDVLRVHKQDTAERGNIVAFNYGDKLMIKRCIAVGGDVVTINVDGSVYVNDAKLDEPYVEFAVLGDCNISFPYEVPEGKYFVMGDHRAASLDSRNTAIGCVDSEQLIGVVTKRILPVGKSSKVK